ncbi:hypothetical protein BDU57DRAFT_10403 [Ampelomyces quisqualis]|uniref:Uncharacterized protein n=1 Tax=Ampelomyces quisqualis TaxID=50730 RepID=A0A6A5QXZ8_AMPQU|nr:hypothetical protein BDU57DRAFT_10403 [Ampelomyces quisqualis]
MTSLRNDPSLGSDSPPRFQPTSTSPSHPIPTMPRTNILPPVSLYPRARAYCSPRPPRAHVPSPLPPRWLADVRQRVGKCVLFGMTSAQTRDAALVLSALARDWRDLVGGCEGYLTGAEWRGLFRQEVVWGEMVSIPLG